MLRNVSSLERTTSVTNFQEETMKRGCVGQAHVLRSEMAMKRCVGQEHVARSEMLKMKSCVGQAHVLRSETTDETLRTRATSCACGLRVRRSRR